MNVAAVQYKAVKGDQASSLAALIRLARVASQGADLVVLPEMAATGYVFDSPDAVAKVAETGDGATFQALSTVAREADVWLVAGFPERAADRFFNSAMVIDPSGGLAFTYRKTLLYGADLPWAAPGDSGYRAFDTDVGRFTVGICMDLNDDAFTAWCGASGARALAFPTNWIDEGDCPWGYWAWRLDETGVAMVAANSYGPEGDTAFRGESAIIDGRTVLAAAPAVGDGVIRATLKGL